MKLIMIDFDGTLVDTFPFMFRLYSNIKDHYRLKTLSEEDFEAFKGQSLKSIRASFGIPFYKLPLLIKAVRPAYIEHLNHLTMDPLWRTWLVRFKQEGYHLVIVSSNKTSIIKDYLNKQQLDMFDHVYGGAHLHGKGRLLNKVRKDYGLKRHEVLYIGDEIRDIIASKKVGIFCAAVTWGYNDSSLLKQHQPDYLIEDFDDFYQVINKPPKN